MMLIYVTLAQVIPVAELRALFAGGQLGYITYEMIHYYLHHGSPSPGTYLANLKSYHVAHHYINSNRGNVVFSRVDYKIVEIVFDKIVEIVLLFACNRMQLVLCM